MIWENEKIAKERIKSFVERLRRIGIDVKLSGNYPWVYIDKINGESVLEIFKAEHGFTLCFLPIREEQEFKFTDISEIFKLIRKYTSVVQR